MSRTVSRNTFVFLITIAIVILLDQAAKALLVEFMEPSQSVRVIPGVLKFTYVENPGAAFGLFAGSKQLIFWVALAIVVATLIWFFYTRKSESVITFIGLGCIIGGACGNLIDRILRGKVVDFIDLSWWPVFNTADLAIVVGVIIIMISMIFDFSRAERD